MYESMQYVGSEPTFSFINECSANMCVVQRQHVLALQHVSNNVDVFCIAGRIALYNT